MKKYLIILSNLSLWVDLNEVIKREVTMFLRILIFLLFIIFSASFAQEQPERNGSHTKIFQLDKITVSESAVKEN